MSGSSFAKKVGFIGSWKALSILMGLVYFYIVTNWLGPELFGVFTLSLAIVNIPYVMIYSGINEGVIKYTAELKTKEVMKAGLKLEYALSIIAFLFFFLFADFLEVKYGKPIGLPIKIFSLIYLVTPLIRSSIGLSLGFLNVKDVIKIEFLQDLFKIIFVGGLLLLGYGLKGAVVGYTLSVIIVSIFALKVIRDVKAKVEEFEIKKLITYSYWAVIFAAFKTWKTTLILIIGGLYLSSTQIGYYAFGIKVATMSIALVQTSFIRVMFPYLSDFFSREEHDRVSTYLSISIAVVFLSALGILFLGFLFLKYVISFLFAEYLPGINVIYLILIIYSIGPLTMVGVVFKASGRIDLNAKTMIIATLVSVVGVSYLTPIYGLNGLILTLFLAYLTILIIYHVFLRMYFQIRVRLLNRDDVNAIKNVLRQGIDSLNKMYS